MYNSDQKLAFIHEHTTSASVATAAARLFNRTEPLEKHLRTDLCELSIEDVQPFVNELPGVTTTNRMYVISLIRAYVVWCRSKGIIQQDSQLLNLETNQTVAMLKSMYSSPEHLNDAFDKVFHPVEQHTVHNIYRTFLWLAYLGVPMSGVGLIEKSDVHFERNTVVFGAVELEIYMEAIQAFESCVNDTKFAVIHTKGLRFMKRADSKLLLSRGGNKVDVSEFSKLINALPNKKRAELRYDNIKYSGIFYRAYMSECNGVPVDFKFVVEADIRQQIQYGETEKQVYERIMKEARRYSADYAAWKAAFGLE